MMPPSSSPRQESPAPESQVNLVRHPLPVQTRQADRVLPPSGQENSDSRDRNPPQAQSTGCLPVQAPLSTMMSPSSSSRQESPAPESQLLLSSPPVTGPSDTEVSS